METVAVFPNSIVPEPSPTTTPDVVNVMDPVREAYPGALADTGIVTYTASAPGYAAGTGSITLTTSGVVVGDGSGAMLFGNTATVSMAQLDPGNVFGQIQQLAGGHPDVSIAMATDIAGVTITSPVTISAGADTATAVLTGSGLGHVSEI